MTATFAVPGTTGAERLEPEPFGPVRTGLRALEQRGANLAGLAPGLVVPDDDAWIPASALADVSSDALLTSARRRWNTPVHVAMAQVWKAYTYWLTLPAVLGWASARRVPLMGAPDVLVRLDDANAPVIIGLRPYAAVAVLDSDPIAAAPPPGVRGVPDEDHLLAQLHRSLVEEHMSPLIEAVRARTRLSRRTLLGLLASQIAYAALQVAPDQSAGPVNRLLRALDLRDLVELLPGHGGRPRLRRRTCCLAFNIARAKVCAGCCTRSRPAVRELSGPGTDVRPSAGRRREVGRHGR